MKDNHPITGGIPIVQSMVASPLQGPDENHRGLSASIVLCTLNRSSILPTIVESISSAVERSSNSNIELIIVDNGSSDETPLVAKRLAERARFHVAVIRENRRGLCRAKNAGIAAATGDIIIFTDDDCVWAPDFLSQLFDLYRNDKAPIIRGGRVELGNLDDLPFTIKTQTFPETYNGRRHPGGFVHGCNLVIPRGLFEAVGRFDEEFGPGAPFEAAEETELVYRAFKSGFQIKYAPDLVVYHHHGRRTTAEITVLNRSYQIGNGALHAKHGLNDKLLLMNLYYNARNYILEFLGGKKFDAQMKISHGKIVVPQIVGIWRYFAATRWRWHQRTIGG
jgi:glycosyltransferase involved in cell wall biosynthesis